MSLCFSFSLYLPITPELGGRLYHEFHIWIFLSVLLVPISSRVDRQDDNRYLITSCQSFIFLIYFISGCWKLIGVFKGVLAGLPLESFTTGLGHDVATHIITGARSGFIPELILQAPSWIQVLLMTLGVAFELSTAFYIFVPRYAKIGMVQLLGFHAANALILDIPFLSTSLAIAVFLVAPTDGCCVKDSRNSLATNP